MANVLGLRKTIVDAAVDGAVRTGVRRRIVTVFSPCARASRVSETLNDDRTRAQINANRRDTGPPPRVEHARGRPKAGRAAIESNKRARAEPRNRFRSPAG